MWVQLSISDVVSADIMPPVSPAGTTPAPSATMAMFGN